MSDSQTLHTLMLKMLEHRREHAATPLMSSILGATTNLQRASESQSGDEFKESALTLAALAFRVAVEAKGGVVA